MKRIISAAIATLSLALATPSYADAINTPAPKTVVPGGCHMGQCMDTIIERKGKIKEGKDGSLYSVVTSNRYWKDTNGKPVKSQPTNRFISYVYCSTTRPAVIFEDEGSAIAHTLNPGDNDFYGYNISDYPVYWAVCHNILGSGKLMDYFQNGIVTEQAIKLGYPLNLPSDQIRLTNVLEYVAY
jgi:hypothetical protein